MLPNMATPKPMIATFAAAKLRSRSSAKSMMFSRRPQPRQKEGHRPAVTEMRKRDDLIIFEANQSRFRPWSSVICSAPIITTMIPSPIQSTELCADRLLLQLARHHQSAPRRPSAGSRRTPPAMRNARSGARRSLAPAPGPPPRQGRTAPWPCRASSFGKLSNRMDCDSGIRKAPNRPCPKAADHDHLHALRQAPQRREGHEPQDRRGNQPRRPKRFTKQAGQRHDHDRGHDIAGHDPDRLVVGDPEGGLHVGQGDIHDGAVEHLQNRRQHDRHNDRPAHRLCGRLLARVGARSSGGPVQPEVSTVAVTLAPTRSCIAGSGRQAASARCGSGSVG
jgi:hypothetical protein